MWAILDFLYRYGASAEEIGEKLLAELNGMEYDLRTELLHIRLEKGLVAEA